MLPLQVIKDREAPPIALLTLLLKKYGTEALYWEPEIIDTELTRDFNVSISSIQLDKLHAAVNLLINNTYEQYWETFETTNHLFSGTPHIPGEHEPLRTEEIVVGYAQAMLIRNEAILLDDEILRYMGQVFYEDGLSKAPTCLPTALMPDETVPSDDGVYDQALGELWAFTIKRTVEYMNNIRF